VRQAANSITGKTAALAVEKVAAKLFGERTILGGLGGGASLGVALGLRQAVEQVDLAAGGKR
jgi:hypothetical protein